MKLFLQYVSEKISIFPAGNYMFKVNNRNGRKRFEVCPRLTLKTPCSRVSIVNFEQANAA